MIWLARGRHARNPRARRGTRGELAEPPTPDGPTRTLATILDPEGNPIGWAGGAAKKKPRRENCKTKESVLRMIQARGAPDAWIQLQAEPQIGKVKKPPITSRGYSVIL